MMRTVFIFALLASVCVAVSLDKQGASESGGYLSNTDVDAKDEAAFVDILNSLLWDADEDERVQTGRSGEARYSSFRRRGLLRMPMPFFIRKENSLTGNMYRSFTSSCYNWACLMGLKGLASQLRDLIV